jgi:leucine dehydrogenase
MNGLAEVTPWVTGVDVALGGSGDPSPVTAVGVAHAMRAVRTALDGDASLRGCRVVVQGSGHVGSHLARLLVGEGAEVLVSDLFESRADALARELGVTRIGADEALVVRCDILAPCALGDVFDDDTIPHLQCRAIVGAANNQLGVIGGDRMLASRGILYVPDFVANAGGIINIAEEFVGYNREHALERVAEIQGTTARVLALADDEGITPLRAAERIARARIAEEGAGRRWQPGDAAAWTNGAPLRSLRGDDGERSEPSRSPASERPRAGYPGSQRASE